MLKKLYLSVLLLGLCCSVSLAKQAIIKQDSLIDYIKLTDRYTREKKLVNYLKVRFLFAPEAALATSRKNLTDTLYRFNIENKEALKYFIDCIYYKRFLQLKEAENAILKAIEYAHKTDDHYLLYLFYSNMGFLQTDKGNANSAVYSYGLAKKEAIKLNDIYLQNLLNINISDVYYKNGFYSQSLYYLNKAQAAYYKYKLDYPNLFTLINYNKAENFFRIRNYDSLLLYNKKLNGPGNSSYKLVTYQKRTAYYLSLLKHDYKTAIGLIKTLLKDSVYVKSDLEPQHLANAYYHNKQPDSARRILEQMLNEKTQLHHPEVKYQQYELLGKIAGEHNDHKQEAEQYKNALNELKGYVNNLTEVGDNSSQLRISDMESTYIAKAAKYRKERMMLIFVIIFIFLAVVVLVMFYLNIKQKRKYEQLLFTNKKEEIAFINSHEVRNHLSNIIGLLDIMRASDNPEEIRKTKEYLGYSAEQLDNAIKTISHKLSEEH
ncbi:hypothetical protein GCM10023149_12020 [Mucilaginibacter gynuensis]|uniref:Tetratricopeptide repeat protein n=1 Tax=Mucilaginibacter gynuensis TaxID=1302236 RepID=A0ABP8G1J9_9SPHI